MDIEFSTKYVAWDFQADGGASPWSNLHTNFCESQSSRCVKINLLSGNSIFARKQPTINGVIHSLLWEQYFYKKSNLRLKVQIRTAKPQQKFIDSYIKKCSF